MVKQQLTSEKIDNSPVRALEIASKIGSAAAGKNPRDSLPAAPDLNKLATTGEGIRET